MSAQIIPIHIHIITSGALTDLGNSVTLKVHQAKWSDVWVGPQFVTRRLHRAISRGFSMVRRIGEPQGSPFRVAVGPILFVWPPEVGPSSVSLEKLNTRRAA